MKQMRWIQYVPRVFGRVLAAECALELALGSIQLTLVSMISRAAGGLTVGEFRIEYVVGALLAVCGLAFLRRYYPISEGG